MRSAAGLALMFHKLAAPPRLVLLIEELIGTATYPYTQGRGNLLGERFRQRTRDARFKMYCYIYEAPRKIDAFRLFSDAWRARCANEIS